MIHDSFRELIQRELDDDLSPEETAVLQAHLITCAECCREREEYSSIAIGLSRLSKVMPERSFVSQITPEMLEQQQPQPVSLPVRRRIAPAWWRGLSVAAVVVLAVGFSSHWHFGVNQQNLSGAQVAQGPDKTPKQQTPTTDTTRPVAELPASSATDQTLPQVAVGQPSTLQTGTVAPPRAPVAAPQSSPSQVQPAKPTDSIRVADAGQHAGKILKPGNGVGILPPTTDNKTLHHTGDNLTSSQQNTGSGVVSPAGDGTIGTSIARVVNVGATPALPDLFNSQLQQQVNRGESLAAWATDTFQVVQHCMTELGFSSTAMELTTVDASRVHVLQSGVLYEVQLVQPFDQGTKGIWRPTRIGRGINETNPVGYEQAILNYFNAQVANGTLTGRQEVFVVSNVEGGRVTVTLNEQHTALYGENIWTDVQYDLTLNQDTAGVWSVIYVKSVQP
jgi:anti-sigma factor RsiW